MSQRQIAMDWFNNLPKPLQLALLQNTFADNKATRSKVWKIFRIAFKGAYKSNENKKGGL